MHKLRRQQPGLHRELCEIVFRLQRVKDTLIALPEAFVLEGAISEILLLTEPAMQEVRDSLGDTSGHRRRVPLTVSREADQALIGALCNHEPDARTSKQILLLDNPGAVRALSEKS